MSVLVLKIIAMGCMLLDHIGYLTGSYALRCIGRLAFPIFAYLIGNGLRHTADPRRYLMRLLILAVLSQIPYTLFLYGVAGLQKLNIFFPLSLGLAWLWSLDRSRSAGTKLLSCLVWLGITVALETIVPMDYGLRGVLLIVVFYYCDRNRPAAVLAFLSVYYLPIWDALLGGAPLPGGWQQSLFGMLALPLIFSYNGQRGYAGRHKKHLQTGFYLFYPVHLLVLHLIFH